MQAILSYDNAPPFSAPLRYFLSAPCFAAAAGVLLVVDGPGFYVSRWMPATLAFTHLITLGFMMMVMVGALIQVLPVVMGVTLVQARRVVVLTHLGLALGLVALVAAFLSSKSWLFTVASLLLGGALGLFLISVTIAAMRVDAPTPSVAALKSSFLGFAGTLVLGLLLAFGLALGWALPYAALTDLHATWGLAAWSGVLLAALSYITVPMFQLTPVYPSLLTRHLSRLLMTGAVLQGFAVLVDVEVFRQLALLVLSVAGIWFVLTSLALQRKRRRARRDSTFLFWQLGLGCAFLALAMLLYFVFYPNEQNIQQSAFLFASLLGIGGYVSLMTGMLYKIVPFLAWLHLQNLGPQKPKLPSMAELLPERFIRQQLVAHCLALLLLLAAVFWPVWFARAAGFVFLLSQLFLFSNLLLVGLSYRKVFQTASNFAAR